MLLEGAPQEISSVVLENTYGRIAYVLWDIRAAKEMVIFALFESFDFYYNDNLYLGDGQGSFSTRGSSCCSWNRLNDLTTPFNMTSLSTSVKLIYTSLYTQSTSRFFIKLEAAISDTLRINEAGK